MTLARLVSYLLAPAAPVPVLDDGHLDQLLADGEVDAADFAYCPTHKRITAHALHTDGSQSCWDCQTALTGAS